MRKPTGLELPGDRFRRMRRSLGLSQQKLADAIAISRSYIGDVETNRIPPSKNLIAAIKTQFDASEQWFAAEMREAHLADSDALGPNEDAGPKFCCKERILFVSTLVQFGEQADGYRDGMNAEFLRFIEAHGVSVAAADCYMELHRLVDELQAMGCTRQAAIDFLLRNNATAEQAVLYAIGAKQ